VRAGWFPLRRSSQTTFILTLLVGMVAVTMTPACSREDTMNRAIAAEKEGRHEDALTLLRPMAADGNPAAAQLLGDMYVFGHGVAVDDAVAQSWYDVAARGGVANGRPEFGVAIELAARDGDSNCKHRATLWLQKAADRGNESARRILQNPADLARRGFETSKVDTAPLR
jgi:hypothetical protein